MFEARLYLNKLVPYVPVLIKLIYFRLYILYIYYNIKYILSSRHRDVSKRRSGGAAAG